MTDIELEIYNCIFSQFKHIGQDDWKHFLQNHLEVAEPFLKWAYIRADAKNLEEFEIECPGQNSGLENSENLKKMLDKQLFTDVELVAKDGKTIRAHKSILAGKLLCI